MPPLYCLLRLLRCDHAQASPAGRSLAGGDNVWAGWVPASGGEGETTAAEMRQKLRAKAGEGGGDDGGAAKRAEARQLEEESVTRERSIGSGALGLC